MGDRLLDWSLSLLPVSSKRPSFLGDFGFHPEVNFWKYLIYIRYEVLKK